MEYSFQDKTIGIAFTGSFCTFEHVFDVLSEFCHEKFDIYPILSETTTSLSATMQLREAFLQT